MLTKTNIVFDYCDKCERDCAHVLTGFGEYYNRPDYECGACAAKREEDGPSDDELANGLGVEGGIGYPIGVH